MLRPPPASEAGPGGTKVKEHAMSEKINPGIAVVGIDIGKNSFHVVGSVPTPGVPWASKV